MNFSAVLLGSSHLLHKQLQKFHWCVLSKFRVIIPKFCRNNWLKRFALIFNGTLEQMRLKHTHVIAIYKGTKQLYHWIMDVPPLNSTCSNCNRYLCYIVYPIHHKFPAHYLQLGLKVSASTERFKRKPRLSLETIYRVYQQLISFFATEQILNIAQVEIIAPFPPAGSG